MPASKLTAHGRTRRQAKQTRGTGRAKVSMARQTDPAARKSRDYDYTVQVGYLLRRAYQSHMAIFQRLNLDPQLTSVQFAALCALRDNGPSSLTVLGRATGADFATIRGVVERLQDRKLVSIRSDSTDQRKVIVQIDETGDALVRRMIPVAREINALTVSGLNPAERVALVYLLDKIVKAQS